MKKVDERFLVGSMYAPFCRTLSAPMDEWDRDMQNMARLGYTCLHGFAEWHDIEYEKGRFDFTKIDHFVNCAHKNGLVAIINVATQNGVGFYSPRWLMEEYRGVGEGVVDAQWQTLSQEEYVVPCMDDPIYAAYAARYLKAVAQHFAGDERVGAFVLWGEPVIHSSHPHGLKICYCKHTKAKFREWLRERYDGDISKLNEAWGREGPSDYIDFCQVNPPTDLSRQKGGFNSWEDWSEYMEYNLAEHIRRADRIFKENGALQPTITEMLPGTNNGIDPWQLGEGTDIVGVSLFGKPDRNAALCMNMSNSIAKALGKSIFVVEAGGGSIKFDDPNPFAAAGFTPSLRELKTTVLMRAGYGAKGIMFWCWRPRLSDVEGNDFGMCRPDGKPLKRTVLLGEFARRMEKLSSLYDQCDRRSDVAVYTSQQINHIMSGDKMSNNYLSAVRGANYMLTDLHINSDFLCEKEILKGSLSKYKVLIMPCTYVLSEKCADAIADFVKKGGHVIADYILAEKRPGGLCYTNLPGAGLDKVFGIEREDVLFIAHPTMERENCLGIESGMMLEQITLTDAESIRGEYMPEYPLVSKNTYGEGSAVYIATQFFSKYASKPASSTRQVLLDMLVEYGIEPYATFESEDKKSCSALVTSMISNECNTVNIITVSNTDYECVEDSILLPEGSYKPVEEIENYTVSQENGKTKIRFTLDSLETLAVYRQEE